MNPFSMLQHALPRSLRALAAAATSTSALQPAQPTASTSAPASPAGCAGSWQQARRSHASAAAASAAAEGKERAWQQLRRSSATLPGLVGQTILAQVVSSSADTLLVDPGFYGLCSVLRKALGTPQAYDRRGRPVAAAMPGLGPKWAAAASPSPPPPQQQQGALPGAPPPSQHLRPGHYIRLRVSSLFTPYGDMQLDPVRVTPAARRKLVWQALEGCMTRGLPVSGRVLNACGGGYAVGVAGYVALLPFNQARPEEVASIGTLQEFYLHSMDAGKRLITLSYYSRKVPGSMYGNL